jgi:hypothetical protein
VTGGGYIDTARGKANFGVTGGIRKDAFRGHLTYIDHSTGLRLKGTGVTAYVVVDARTRHIEGTTMIDGVAGTYKVDVTDNGERGRNDRFAIALSSGYRASGTLAGGNIELHKRDCDKAGDDDDDDAGERRDDDKDHGNTPKPYGSGDKTHK